MDKGYPKKISKGFKGVPASGIDAAFVWSGNDLIYFFKVSPSRLSHITGWILDKLSTYT